MKNTCLKTVGFLLILFFLSSFVKEKVTFSKKQIIKVDKIAYISTYLDLNQDFALALGATMLNNKTNAISRELNDLLRKQSRLIRESVASLLKNKLQCTVLYGDSLHVYEGYELLSSQHNFDHALAKKNDNFPFVINSEGDVNFFEFDYPGRDSYIYRVPHYLEKSKNVRRDIVEICNRLNVSLIAISHSNVFLNNSGPILKPKISVATRFYLFDKEGDCLVNGQNSSRPMAFDAEEIAGYEKATGEIPSLINPIIEKIAVQISEK